MSEKNRETDKFKGIFIALHTALRKETFDPSAQKNLITHYHRSGVNGLYVGGSSGEGILLSVEERKSLLETVMNSVDNNLKVIVHVGAPTTKESRELARHAEKSGAHAISAVPSVYYSISEKEIEKHWCRIIDSCRLPFIIYNIPTATNYHLSPELLKRMCAHPRVIGLKNTSLSVQDMFRFKEQAPDNFVLYNGSDEQYLAGRVMGANGGIGGSYGAMPELFVALESAIRNSDLPKAQKLQYFITKTIAEIYSLPSFLGGIKEIIKLRFTDIGGVRSPLANVETKEDKEKALRITEKITETVSGL